MLSVAVPGDDEPVEVDALLFGDPGRAVEPLRRLQHVGVEPLDQLLLRGHVQPLLLQVMGQRVDVQLHHGATAALAHTQGGQPQQAGNGPCQPHTEQGTRECCCALPSNPPLSLSPGKVSKCQFHCPVTQQGHWQRSSWYFQEQEHSP